MTILFTGIQHLYTQYVALPRIDPRVSLVRDPPRDLLLSLASGGIWACYSKI